MLPDHRAARLYRPVGSLFQGFNVDAGALGQVGAIPEGEAVIRVPWKLMRHLKEAHGATEL